MTEIFDRSDPTRTGASGGSGPSTGATDSTLNKEGSALDSAVNNAPMEPKPSLDADGA